MTALDKLRILHSIIRWRLTWDKRDTHYRFTVPENPTFMGPRDAVGLIRDGDVLAFSGLAGNQQATIMYWAIREVYEETGHPRDITAMTVGGMGGRGIVPGTIEELGQDGLCTRFISGHLETFKAMLRLAEKGKLELQCLPQGTMSLLFEAQARGEDSVLVGTGVGTVFDPRIGRGTTVAGQNAQQLVTIEDDKLRYRIPRITVAIFNAPAADRKGNIYMTHCSMIAEIPEIIRAAKRHNGVVIANVQRIVDEGYDRIFLTGDLIDAIVLSPPTDARASMRATIWESVPSADSLISLQEKYERLRFANRVLGVTPRRTRVEDAIARLAATTFADNATKGASVNIGTGLPEEVCRNLFEAGLLEQITFFTESGVIGGIPAPGIFFGAAVGPDRMISSAEIFKEVATSLDVTILGYLQVDSEGNVNSSKRGDGPLNYVGPGGFIDFSMSAKMVIFVGKWMARATTKVVGNTIKIVTPGKPKFVDKVDEITFSGKEALKSGKKVFYATDVGLFRLTERGMQLSRVMPGIDVQNDIIAFSPMRIVLPESGRVPVIDDAVVTGKGFSLNLENSPA
jgi:propionate CoA-transferase